jgi:hypothetical protein
MLLRHGAGTGPVPCQDYLFIPELQTDMTAVDTDYGSRLCSTQGSPVPNIFYCKWSA